MTTYSPISDGEVDAESPVTDLLLQRFRDNPIAIAEGDPTAPKIQTIALQPPTGAGTHTIRRVQSSAVQTAESAYLDSGLHDRLSASQHLGFTVLVPGTIVCFLEHRAATAATDSLVRIVRNGTVLAEWTNGSTTFMSRSLITAVDIGDQIIFQQRINGISESSRGEWRNLLVLSGNKNMAVA